MSQFDRSRNHLVQIPLDVLQGEIIETLPIEDQLALTRTCKALDHIVQSVFFRKLTHMHPSCESALVAIIKLTTIADERPNGKLSTAERHAWGVEQHTMRVADLEPLTRAKLVALASIQGAVEYFTRPELLFQRDGAFGHLLEHQRSFYLGTEDISDRQLMEWSLYNRDIGRHWCYWDSANWKPPAYLPLYQGERAQRHDFFFKRGCWPPTPVWNSGRMADNWILRYSRMILERDLWDCPESFLTAPANIYQLARLFTALLRPPAPVILEARPERVAKDVAKDAVEDAQLPQLSTQERDDNMKCWREQMEAGMDEPGVWRLLSICLSVCLPVCLSLCLGIYLFVQAYSHLYTYFM